MDKNDLQYLIFDLLGIIVYYFNLLAFFLRWDSWQINFQGQLLFIGMGHSLSSLSIYLST